MRRGPKSSSSPKLSTVIQVPMTPEDREKLEALAAANGMTAAKLVRTVMFDRQTELLAA